ncbi:DUF4240 domain-containing protein [Bacillus sp. REN3]|uniref:DUF4240 domain-containing protein n=1 Tax=Bacillus sp. REN3 TaxID=2802440 RepID=UPI001AEEE31D|nr:DUF4240 domain-containing protein [Bacillus sp. REN3]
METLLIYQDGTSNKFWKIAIAGKSYTITYGKIGTVGAIKAKGFETKEICEKEAAKLINSKLKKGYRVAETANQVIKESSMTEDLFWGLLETAKQKGEDLEEQFEWLVSHLMRKPLKDIVLFDYFFNENYRKSYTSDLWAAAYIVMGGCSDDCFDYFRAWLMYLGKESYYACIEDPEKMIPYLKILEEAEEAPQFEDLLMAASMAYEEKTGMDFDEYYDLYVKLTGDEQIDQEIEFDWDEDDEEGLKRKYPLLWKHFGHNPLE